MKIYIYDLEVVEQDWIAVFKRPEDDAKHIVIHNDAYRLREFITQEDIVLCGFNNKHYDDHILKVIYHGGSNVEVKRCSDFIVEEKQNGWDFPFLRYKKKPFKSFDLKDDLPRDLSLKAIEGNMRLPIVESSVSFKIKRKLTVEELNDLIYYCKKDVDATCMLYQKRKEDYLDAKAMVAEMYGFSAIDGLSKSNSTLSGLVLGAKNVQRDDERDYIVPDNIDVNLIPKVVLDFYMLIRDKSIPSEKLFGDGKGKKGMTQRFWLKTARGACPVTCSWGGIHGGKPCVTIEETEQRAILNYDVASLYPNSMINFGYCSRSMENPKSFEQLVKRRLEYKKAGQKKEANALKLVVNTVYGAMLNKDNALEDRWAGRSVCISNQLAITMLIVMLAKKCASIDFININTDGIMFELDRDEIALAESIISEWSDKTKFEMERDDFKKVIQKDVNNYIGIMTNGKVKTKGSFISSYGGGNFKSNSMSILDNAVVEFLVKDIPIEKTINDCPDIFAFQRIEKTGSTFEGSYQYVNGERFPIQNVNRIYATTRKEYGQIVKGKWITEKRKKDKASGKMISTPVEPPIWQENTLPDCPEHAIIDNENKLTVNDIDKNYYIDVAKKRIDKYLNIDPKVQRELDKIKEEVVIMAEKKETNEPMNVYKKLLEARKRFLEAPVKKSGINRHAEYKYFELEDIVPVAESIFYDLGLLFIVQFTKDEASGTLINTDNTDEMIVFTSPMVELTVVSKEGVEKAPAGMNSVQALGSTETYQRRYLYMTCLDIVEADAFDATQGKPIVEDDGKVVEITKGKKNRPATTEERQETKEQLTGVDESADDMQKKAIKRGLKALREKDEKYEPYISEVLKKLKSDISKKEAEDLLIEVGEKVNE